MKCLVNSCEFNKKQTCLKTKSVSKAYINSKIELQYKIINNIVYVIVISKTYDSILRFKNCIINLIYKKYPNYKNIIFDLTLSQGTKSEDRYVLVESITNKCIRINKNTELIKSFKVSTCNFLRSNQWLLNNCILNTVQKRMILKGLNI